MKLSQVCSVVLILSVLSTAAHAHRLWLLPSTSVLSGEGPRISVEGAISNDLFFPNHMALPLAATTAIAPSGELLELLSPAQGKIRCSFELQLDEQGSYRITTINDMIFLRWEEDGETKYARGTPAEIDQRDLASLNGVALSRWISRVETYVTCGAPTTLTPTGQDLEFEFITHPNDLFHGEVATFRVLLDGQPKPDAEVTLVKGNDRFRDAVNEIVVTSDAEGLIHIEWPEPGRYWLATSAEQAPGEYKGLPLKRGSAYFATLEVLPQ